MLRLSCGGLGDSRWSRSCSTLRSILTPAGSNRSCYGTVLAVLSRHHRLVGLSEHRCDPGCDPQVARLYACLYHHAPN
jgi:hypothetical protein